MLSRKSGFLCSYLPVRIPKVKVPSGVVQMRPWQQECSEEFLSSDFKHCIINSPTGSGKSKSISYLVSDVLTNTDKKVIIAVPQKVIGGGFSEIQKFKLCDGTIVDYRIEERNNLCQKDLSKKGKTKGLIRFFEDDACVTFSDRIILCTHATLYRVFENLKRKKRLRLFDDTVLWVDEAHHIMNSGNGNSNKLGHVARHYIENEARGLSINLATATLFRGDRAPILPKKYEDKFIRYNLPYDRHFEENCQGLTFSYDFLLHDKSWFEAIKSLFKDKVGKTIVFIPHPKHGASSGYGKYQEVRQVIWAVAGRKNCKIEEDENGILYVNRKGKKITIIDIVEENDREKKLEYLRENPDNIDVVIGMNVPKEGFDWPCANREIIIGHKKSLNELIQMMGRTFRYHPDKAGGKTPVEIVQVLPWVDQKKLDKTALRDQLNDFMKAVYATLILESVMNLVDIDVPTSKKSKKDKKNTINLVQEYIKAKVGDTEYIDLWEKIIDVLIDYRNANPAIDKDKFDEQYSEIIKQELSKTKIDKFHEEISLMILGSFKRRTSNIIRKLKESLSGIDVNQIDADIINEFDPIGFLVGYTNSLCSVQNLRDFRNRISHIGFVASAQQHMKWIKRRYTKKTWISEGYPKYKSQGALYDPVQTFGKNWAWFYYGKDFLKKSAEQHREWIQKEGYNYVTWVSEGYLKYKDQGAFSSPQKSFKKPWSWFSGNNNLVRSKASVKQHRKWIKGRYTQKTWVSEGYPKYKNQGAVCDPTKTLTPSKCWSWFSGLVRGYNEGEAS